MIYVHIPFCRSFCTYCGFYSEVAGSCPQTRYEEYIRTVCEEAAGRRDEIARTRDVNTLYIGGGTPSVLPLSCLQTLLEALPYGPWEEFTLEANPEDICEKGMPYLQGLRKLGVTRVSLGFQSFDDGILRWMNRRHTAARARDAFALLREAGFDNISIDLIFGLSNLDHACWEDTVRQALALRPEHISAYQLSIEEGSALEAQMDGGKYREASESHYRAQYDVLCHLLGEAGYHHYEVSNFALPGFEARHNAAYWRRVPYVGLGAAAHSFDGRCRRWNTSQIADYHAEYEVLSEDNARVETIMLGLRTDVGIEASLVDAGPLLAEGALVRCGDRVRIPEDHFFVSDDIIRQLI